MHQTDAFSHYAAHFLNVNADEPFFLMISTDAPHWPDRCAPLGSLSTRPRWGECSDMVPQSIEIRGGGGQVGGVVQP